jgi:hypothetical protein
VSNRNQSTLPGWIAALRYIFQKTTPQTTATGIGASSDAKRVIGVHTGEYCRGTKWFIKLGVNIDRAASPKSVAAPNNLDVGLGTLFNTFFGPRPVPLPFLLAAVDFGFGNGDDGAKEIVHFLEGG